MKSARRTTAVALLTAGIISLGLAPASAADDGPLHGLLGGVLDPVTDPITDPLGPVVDPILGPDAPSDGPTTPSDTPTVPTDGPTDGPTGGTGEPTGPVIPTDAPEEPTDSPSDTSTGGPIIVIPPIDLPGGPTPPGQDGELPPGQDDDPVPPGHQDDETTAPSNPQPDAPGVQDPAFNGGVDVAQPEGQVQDGPAAPANFACYDAAVCLTGNADAVEAAAASAGDAVLPQTGAPTGMLVLGIGGLGLVLAGVALLRRPRALHRA
jgi:LPXTG-motif cell wall-anchored protein